jgi:hypothetical protein
MTSTELEPVMQTGEIVNRRDLRNRATDSWTDVLEEVGDLADRIAQTDFVPATFKGSVPAVAATILAGREIGFAPMTALASLHSIKGKVGLYAEAMRALVFQAGHEIVVVESTSAVCKMKGKRAGSTEWTEVAWSQADARQAGLLNSNKNWQTYPRQMLQARASTELCRLLFPDVIRGLASVEELETLDVPPGAPGAVSAGDGETKAVERAPRRRRAKAEPTESPAPPLPDEAVPETGAETGPAVGRESDSADSAPPLPDGDMPAAADGSGGSDAETPSPSSTPDPSPSTPDEEGAYPAEVVEDEVEAEPRMDASQRPAMMAGFTGLGVKDKAERMQITCDLVGREVTSANDLTKREASSVIETLAMCKTRDELEAIIQQTVAHREKKADE